MLKKLPKTITVISQDGSIYAVFDYIDWLQFCLKRLTDKELNKTKLFIRNHHGGINEIDEFSCVPTNQGDVFPQVEELLTDIINAQIKKR